MGRTRKFYTLVDVTGVMINFWHVFGVFPATRASSGNATAFLLYLTMMFTLPHRHVLFYLVFLISAVSGGHHIFT